MLDELFDKEGRKEIEMIVFNVDGNMYATDVYTVERVIDWIEPTPMPFMSNEMIGIFNERGSIIPLLSLSAIVSANHNAIETEKQILITNKNDKIVGFEINGNTSILRVTKEDICSVPDVAKTKNESYLLGLIKHKKEIIGILNIDVITKLNREDLILADEENKKIKELL